MYTAVRHYKIKSGSFGEIEQRIDGFVNIVSKVSGFVGYYFVNTGNDTLVTVSIFESQAGADESTRAAAEWVKENLAALVEGPPTIMAGEVVAHKTK